MTLKISFAFLMVSLVSSAGAFAQDSATGAKQRTSTKAAQNASKNAPANAREAARQSALRAKSASSGTPAKAATSKTASQPPGAGAPSGGGRSPASINDSNNALEVRGQARNLSMMLTLRNRGNDINFVKPRENYKNEIQNTSY